MWTLEGNSLYMKNTEKFCWPQRCFVIRVVYALNRSLYVQFEESHQTKSACQVVVYGVLVLWFWSTPVTTVPKHLLQPFGKFMPFT